MPDERRVLSARIVVDGDLVAAIHVAGAVRNVDHIPVLRLDGVVRVQPYDERAHQARAGVRQDVQVVVGDAVRIARAPDAARTGATRVIPTRAAAFHVDDRVARAGHAIDEELVLGTVAADRAGGRRELDGLPPVVRPGLPAVGVTGWIAFQSIRAGRLAGAHGIVGAGREREVPPSLQGAVVAFFSVRGAGEQGGEYQVRQTHGFGKHGASSSEGGSFATR